jgi:putative oxidoreductase
MHVTIAYQSRAVTPMTQQQSYALTLLRIFAGLAFFSHGAQKLLGWFGGFGPEGGTAELMSRFGVAGVIELVGGLLIVIGLFTRIAAFIASGEMAVAYFWMHSMGSGSIWWWENRGETVMLFSFLWLFFAAYGAGPYSVDAWLARRRSGIGNG